MVATSPLNPAAPSFVFGGSMPVEAMQMAPQGTGGGQQAAFGGQLFGGGRGAFWGCGSMQFGTPVQLFNPADGTPVVMPTQPFLQVMQADRCPQC